MERPKKYQAGQLMWWEDTNVYRSIDIDPLLDELERLKADKKPFPSFEEWFIVWNHNITALGIYNYFSQFQYETKVYPKVRQMVEYAHTGEGKWYVGKITGFVVEDSIGHTWNCSGIRPFTRPTREEVVAKVESKLDNDELTFDRELVEQFLRILRGDK